MNVHTHQPEFKGRTTHQYAWIPTNHLVRIAFLGSYIRKNRDEIRTRNRTFHIHKVAQSIGVKPSYSSKTERPESRCPSEAPPADWR